MNNNYAIGIVTCNRPQFCKNLVESLPKNDNIFIENTGEEIVTIPNTKIHKFQKKTPVVFGKNALFRRILQETDVDHIFILEDDIIVKDHSVFDKYIETSQKTGIQHFNFGFSQRENLDEQGKPLYKKIVDYPNGARILLTHNVLGAFSYYSRKCLEDCGIMDERFDSNAFEHCEHTVRIQQKKYCGYFWNFEDVYGSWDLIGNQGSFENTTIRNDQTYINKMRQALEVFRKIHGYNLLEIFHVSESVVLERLKEIYVKNVTVD